MKNLIRIIILAALVACKPSSKSSVTFEREQLIFTEESHASVKIGDEFFIRLQGENRPFKWEIVTLNLPVLESFGESVEEVTRFPQPGESNYRLWRFRAKRLGKTEIKFVEKDLLTNKEIREKTISIQVIEGFNNVK